MVGDDGLLYAGGSFTTAGGVAAKAIARWDGIQWHSLGSGLNGHVYALAVGPDGSLYAGGNFTTAGDKMSSRIAQWTGEATPSSCCDFDGDGTVDIDDIVIIAGFWNQPAGQPYDQDGDGMITIVDIQRVARWWGVAVP
jgi:hypothetical protein